MNPKSESQQRFVESLAWLARGLVFCLLLAAPWPYGMAEWASQIWLVPVVSTILLIALIVAVKQRISVGNPVVWSFAAILLVGLIQIIPLPEPLWALLSPSAGFQAEVNKLANEFKTDAAPESDNTLQIATTLTGSRTISIYPAQTRTTLCILAMGLAMLISTSLLFRDKHTLFALYCVMLLSGLAVALLGIYQAIVAGDWTFLKVPKATSFGTFYSRNSAPQFLACSFAAVVGLLAMYRHQKGKQQDKRYQLVYPSVNMAAKVRRRIDDFVTDSDPFSIVCLLVLALLFISVLTANSRGGILAFMASGLVVGLVYTLGKQVSFTATLGVVALIVGAAVFLPLFGLDELIGARLDTISAEAYKLDNARLELWKMAASQASFWGLGSGLGTFHFAVLPTYEKPQTTWFYHAENIYVELASNAGVVTLLFALVGLIWLLQQLLTDRTHAISAKAARFACLFSILAVGLQNMVDFSLILPAVFLPLATLVGAFLGSRGDGATSNKRQRGNKRTQAHADNGFSPTQPSTREGNIDYPQRKPGQPAGARHISPPTWRPLGLVSSLVLITVSTLLGYRNLAAFAYAEQLPRESEGVDVAELPAWIADVEQSRWADFPETQLQLGRWRQQLSQQQLESSRRWPADVNPGMRNALSRPEFFSAVFHGTTDSQLLELKTFIVGEVTSLNDLRDSQDNMRIAIAACPYDWRGNWGLMRADVGDMSDRQRRENYARVLLTCRNNQPVMQSAATHALMAGQTAAGLRFWRDMLPVSPPARSQILFLLDRFLTIEQLVGILPESWMQRLEMAQALQQRGSLVAAEAVLATVDLDEAFSQASLPTEWPLIAWGAALNEDTALEIDAWKEAVLDQPQQHAHGYSLALAYQKAGLRGEALQAIEAVLERAPSNTEYQALKAQLQQ